MYERYVSGPPADLSGDAHLWARTFARRGYEVLGHVRCVTDAQERALAPSLMELAENRACVWLAAPDGRTFACASAAPELWSCTTEGVPVRTLCLPRGRRMGRRRWNGISPYDRYVGGDPVVAHERTLSGLEVAVLSPAEAPTFFRRLDWLYQIRRARVDDAEQAFLEAMGRHPVDVLSPEALRAKARVERAEAAATTWHPVEALRALPVLRDAPDAIGEWKDPLL